MREVSPAIRLLGIGFYIVTCIVLGTLAGRELDRALDTDKVFTLIGLALGLALALYGGVQQLMEVLEAIRQRGQGGKTD